MSTADASAPRVRAPLLIGLGAVLVAALAYALLVAPGQDGVSDVDETQAVGPEPAPAPSSAPAPTGAPDGAEPGAVPSEEPGDGEDEPSFEVFDARDPFEQLVSDADPAGVGDTQDTAAPDGTLAPPIAQPGDTGEGGAPDQGGAPGGPGTPGDGTAPGASGGRPDATVGTTTIRLEEVFDDGGTDMVLVLINSDGYEAAEGETVAGSLTVLDIEDSCATMRYDGRRFVLCEGEQVRK